MKVNKERMRNQIDEIVNYGAAHCEECDLTVNKVMQVIEPLVLAVEAIPQMQPEWVALEQENEKLRKTIELAISGLEMYNNTGGLYVDIKLALRASIGMELITVNGDIDARPQPPTK